MHFISSLSLLALPSIIHAIPVLFQRAINQEDFATISYYGQYAAASYCSSNIRGEQQTNLTCQVGNCIDVQGANQNTVLKFENVGATGSTGFVATDRTRNLIVVSFRGTQSLQNIRGNLNLALVPIDDICVGCKAHGGFYQSWVDVRDAVIDMVNKTSAANPDFKVLVTGHSLGAGIATIAGVELRKRGYVVDLAPYASSRVGNSVFADLITNQAPSMGRNFRVIHVGDPLPDNLPTNVTVGGNYAHFTPAFQITTLSGVTPTANNLSIISADNITNAPRDITPDQSAHGFYINGISDCGDISVADVFQNNLGELLQIASKLVVMYPALGELLDGLLEGIGVPVDQARQVAIDAGGG